MDKRRLYSKASAPRDPRDPHRTSLGSGQPRARNRRVAKPVRMPKRDTVDTGRDTDQDKAPVAASEQVRPASALSDMSADTMASGIEQPRGSPPQATPEQPKPQDDAMLRFRGEDILADLDDFAQDVGGQFNTSTVSDQEFARGANDDGVSRRSPPRQRFTGQSRQSLPSSSTTAETAKPRRTKMKTRPVQSRYLSATKPAGLNASTASDRRASRGGDNSRNTAAHARTPASSATPAGATTASSSSTAARRAAGGAGSRRAPLPRRTGETSKRASTGGSGRGDGAGARLKRRNGDGDGGGGGGGGISRPRRAGTRSTTAATTATGGRGAGDDSMLSRHLRLRAYVLQWMYVVALQERGMRQQEATATQAFRAATSYVARVQQQVTRLALTKEAVTTHHAVDKATRTLTSNMPEPQAMARLQETLHGVLSALDARSRQLALRGVLGESSGDLAGAFQDAHAHVRDLGIFLGTRIHSSDLLHQATRLKEILQAVNSSANELAGMLHHATRGLYKLSTLQYQRQHVQGAVDSPA